MRLFTKIFFFGTLVFGLAFSGAGYLLLHYSVESSLGREVDFALTQFQYDKFTVQAALLSYSDSRITAQVQDISGFSVDGRISFWQVSPQLRSGWWNFQEEGFPGEADGNAAGEVLFSMLAEDISAPVAFFAEDKTAYYSEIEGFDLSFLDGLSKGAHGYCFRDTPQGSHILVGGVLDWDMTFVPEDGYGGWEWAGADTGTWRIYFVTQWDISKTVAGFDSMRQVFFRCYGLGMAAGMALLGFLSAFLSGSLKRMAEAACRMARGDYQERLVVRGRDEIGELAGSFNRLAAAVEEKIQKLQEAAREKEDFVANFAHELKTPLTSIIGYADMIYQKELSREEVRKASGYIWNEGMRLEALSLKLMDLTVLGRQDFILQEMPSEELLRDVAEGLEPVLREKRVELSFRAQAAYIRVEYDLFKSLLINLMDNSVKGGCSRIELLGEAEGEEYRISVRDDGCGIRKEELSRITEAFYMVDKARSRKWHGAGLGLALAERIANIHGGGLVFESEEGSGTTVSFCLKCEKGGMEDGESE